MNHFLNTSCRANSVNQPSHLYSEQYASFDLCSQGRLLDGEDNILSRMESLRAYAREQKAKRAVSQKLQTSFCF